MDLPAPFLAMLVDAFPPDRAAAIAAPLPAPRRRAFRANLLRQPVESLTAELTALGIPFEPHRLSPWSFTTDATGEYALKGSAPYREGRLYTQSLASQLPALVPPLEPGDGVLEACSAPGGKTTLLAMRVAPAGCATPGVVVALERAAVRFQKLQHTLKLQGAGRAVRAFTCDARFPPREAEAPFRAAPLRHLLLDPPCSGTGLIRVDDPRSFDTLLQDYEGYIASRARIQASILAAWAVHVPPGGTLTYSTCSIDPREDEAVIDDLLADPQLGEGLELVDLAPWQARLGAAGPGLSGFRGRTFRPELRRCLRLDPSAECEGFFVAHLMRKT